jgi:Uma2 family endonuclease
MATALDRRHRTLADFLAWKEQQAERYEWVGRRVRMMTGGTIDHARIIRNVAFALDRLLQSSDCEVFTNDVKVATRLETSVVGVEVLSDSTAARDHGSKRWAYQTIASLSHLVLVDQFKPVVEVATRDRTAAGAADSARTRRPCAADGARSRAGPRGDLRTSWASRTRTPPSARRLPAAPSGTERQA